MFLKFLVLCVIIAEQNFVIGERDIYELEFWSRKPKPGANRRSFYTQTKNPNERPMFRSVKKKIGNGTAGMVRRIRKPLRDKTVGHYEPTSEHPSYHHETSYHDKTVGHYEPTTHHSTKIEESPMHLVGKSTRQPEEESTVLEQSQKEDVEHSVAFSAYSIKKTMEDIAQEVGKETNITVEVIGRTFEYNDIVMLKMAETKSVITKYFRADDNKYMDDVPEKQIIFIVHGLSTKSIKEVPCLSKRDEFLQLLHYYICHLDIFDIYLIPMANPDGFSVTEVNWNKNFSPQNMCHGVALDRNFDVAWGGTTPVGACSRNYPGPMAFSEPETKAIRDIFHRFGHKIIAYINVHAGTYSSMTYKGDAVLYPKGYTEAQTDDDKYIDMKGEIDDAMRNASFQRMTVTTDTLYHWYGKVTGSSVDYASTVFGIPYALEFVMQPYDGYVASAALTAVWQRVIDTVFQFIHHRKDGGDGQKK